MLTNRRAAGPASYGPSLNNHQRAQLEAIFDALTKPERAALLKQAAERRRAGRRVKPRAGEASEPRRAARSSDSVREIALRMLAERGQGAGAGERTGLSDEGVELEGMAVEVGRRRCLVQPDGDCDRVECLLSPDLAATQHEGLAIGDRVVFAPGAGNEPARLVRVLDRRSSLSRPDPRRPGRLRVLVANVDVVVIVVSIASPPLHPRLIDRYLIAVGRGGARPVLCVNKSDLRNEPDAADPALLDPYRAVGVRVIETSPVTGEGVEELRAELAGTVCAFVGHSGVGKSSLVNALCPGLAAAVGQVSEASGKGRHTTTQSSMHTLDNGTRIIDTPGVRSFSVEDVSAEEIRASFHEFEPFAHACKFRDCTHTHEPGCAVRDAAERGRIPAARYETYRRMVEDGGEGRPDRVG